MAKNGALLDIDYVFAFGVSFFFTLLILGVIMRFFGDVEKNAIYYLAVALIVYTVELLIVAFIIRRSEKFGSALEKTKK